MADPAFLIAGAGYTGARLLDALPAGETQALRRGASDDPRVLAVDLDAAPSGLPACETLVYLVPPARETEGDPRLARLLDGLPRPPRRVVYFSTSGVYGDRRGAAVDEDARLNPRTARARRRVAAEALLTEWCTQHRVASCILRVPGIYGPGRLGLERLQRGEPYLADEDSGPGNRIHVDDLVRCAVAAATREQVPAICNVGDGDFRSATAFAREVARQAGLPPPREVSRAEALQTFSERRLSFLQESRKLVLDRMRNELKLAPLYPDAADGIRASLAAANQRSPEVS